jgi:hypothetical protein
MGAILDCAKSSALTLRHQVTLEGIIRSMSQWTGHSTFQQSPGYRRPLIRAPTASRRSLRMLHRLCAIMLSMKKKRRPGATETFSVSVDGQTKRRLKALAASKHGGNVFGADHRTFGGGRTSIGVRARLALVRR